MRQQVFDLPQETNRVLLKNQSCLFVAAEHSVGGFRGAGIIIPKLRKSSLFDFTDRELLDTFALLKQVRKFIDKKYQPDGYTIGWNVGEVEGKEICYAYLHIVPRYNGERVERL